MKNWIKAISFLFLITSVSLLTAQDTVDVKKEKEPSALGVLFSGKPGRALAYSLILPGAGQAYNKRYWKIPVVYAAIGTGVYFIIQNKKEYDKWDDLFRKKVDNIPINDPEFENYSITALNAYRKYYERNLQLSYITTSVLWLLNGIEAFIDRHLMTYDVSDDLSLHFDLTPNRYSPYPMAKIKLCLR